MSQPPMGQDPNQQGYGSAPAPQPGYGPVGTGRRPGMVTAAAVLAFISGGLNLLFGLIVLFASDAVADAGVSRGLIVVLAVLGLAFGAVLIFGGLQALNGKDQRILVGVSAAAILLQIITWFTAGFDGSSVLSLILPVVIIALLMQAQSKQWFQSKGAPTF